MNFSQGTDENVETAQKAFFGRATTNGHVTEGKFEVESNEIL